MNQSNKRPWINLAVVRQNAKLSLIRNKYSIGTGETKGLTDRSLASNALKLVGCDSYSGPRKLRDILSKYFSFS